MKLDAESLFEASWEVCNKVGGIYTVIKSKAALVEEYYGSNYILIGPYFHDKAAGEFSEILAPDAIKKIFEEMSSVGIVCRYGKWLIAGQPITILIDFTGYRRNLNDIKKELWGGEFWSKGYFISTVGRHGNEEVIRQYVKQQGSEKTYKKLHRQDVQMELF